MSDSPQALAVGLLSGSGTGLVRRPEFKSRPSGVVADAFLRHVKATGAPETFDQISTTRPPSAGALVVLTEFRAEKGKRIRGDYCPCPICSPTSPQFLHGLLIWCEETAAIYAIGMDCGYALDREGRLDMARSLYDRQQARRRFEDQLLARLPRVPELRRWIASKRQAAVSALRLTRGFRRKVPRVYTLVRQAFQRNGELPVRFAPGGESLEPIRLVGASFLNTSFNADLALARADEMLAALDNGEDELACIETIAIMPEEQVARAIKFLKEADRDIERVYRYLVDCASFVSDENMAKIAKWSEMPGAPFRIMAYSENGRVKVFVYQDKSDWGDRVCSLVDLDPPPSF